MIRATLLSIGLLAATVAVVAQTDVIAERKAIMRGNGAASRTGTLMIRGEAPFDQAKAREVFSGISAGMTRFPTLFPENSKTGGETKAAPSIWEDNAGFRALAAKIVQESNEAATTSTSLETFRANFQRVTANCGSCHQKYRT